MIVGRLDPGLGCRRDPGERRAHQVHAGRSGVAGETAGRRLAEERLANSHRIIRGRLRCRPTDVAAGNRRTRDQDRPRGPAMVVDLPHPGEERDDLVDLLRRQFQIRHQPPVPLLIVELRRIRQEGPQVRRATLFGNLGQVRCVIGALAQQGVAVDAVLPMPDVLARDDLGRDLVRVGEGGELPVAVDRKGDERSGRRARSNRGRTHASVVWSWIPRGQTPIWRK